MSEKTQHSELDEDALDSIDVLSAISRRADRINTDLEDTLADADDVVPETLTDATRHLIEAGGKRLRPVLSVIVAEALVADSDIDPSAVPDGYGNTVDILGGASAVELLHAFTLIHDDIMDDDDLRRGEPAVHREYDESTAILAGDTLYSKSFERLLDSNAPSDRVVNAMNVLATTSTEICEGQAMDIDFETRNDVTPDEYLKMVERKTGVLYGASAAIPAILLGADDATVDALYQYGVDTGCAFQIQDDVLDLTVPSDRLGKQRGSDLVENKQTLITLHARQNGVDVESLLSDDVTAEAVTTNQIDEAVANLEDAGSIDYATTEARSLIESGKENLNVLGPSTGRDTLLAVADFLVDRGY